MRRLFAWVAIFIAATTSACSEEPRQITNRGQVQRFAIDRIDQGVGVRLSGLIDPETGAPEDWGATAAAIAITLREALPRGTDIEVYLERSDYRSRKGHDGTDTTRMAEASAKSGSQEGQAGANDQMLPLPKLKVYLEISDTIHKQYETRDELTMEEGEEIALRILKKHGMSRADISAERFGPGSLLYLGVLKPISEFDPQAGPGSPQLERLAACVRTSKRIAACK